MLALAHGRFKCGKVQFLRIISHGRNSRHGLCGWRLQRLHIKRRHFLQTQAFQLIQHPLCGLLWLCCWFNNRLMNRCQNGIGGHKFWNFQRRNFGCPFQIRQIRQRIHLRQLRFHSGWHFSHRLWCKVWSQWLLLCHFCHLFTHAPAWHQRYFGALAIQAHGIGGSAEWGCRPVLCLVLLQILRPGAKGLERILGQLLHGLGHGFLLGQPGIEHLLHGPACFTKLVKSHHAGAALERMESTAQRGLLAQICGLIGQRLQRLQTIANNFTSLFKEDAQQFVIAVQIIGTQLYRLGHRCRRLLCGHWRRLLHSLLCERLHERLRWCVFLRRRCQLGQWLCSSLRCRLWGNRRRREVEREFIQAQTFICSALARLHACEHLRHGICQSIRVAG